MEDLADWLILHRAPGIGARSFHRLLEQFGTPARVRDAGREALKRCGLKADALDWLNAPDRARIEADLAWAAQPGNHLVTFADPDYPDLLRQLPDPPPLLHVCGDPGLLQMPQLAMVGSRNPSASGEKTARQFARFLAERGLAITSGLALGIDAASHRGALDARGTTVAVMGTGVDRVYPARHRDLAHAVVDAGGALVSELPLGSPPQAGNFPRRNRIISGLSLGVLVVEAALKSGSLITARLASEQGREVFAIPGSIHNTQARGCHALIKSGAKLVETAQDIVEELAPLLGTLVPPEAVEAAAPETAPALDDERRTLLESMGFDPVSVDQLVQQTGLRVEAVSSMLLLLELEGHVSSAPGGLYSRVG